ncbi:MAG: hypothetical protein ACT4PO_16510 [Actinomycetota bacterium]
MTITATVVGAEEIGRRFANTPARMAQLQRGMESVSNVIRAAAAAGSPRSTGALASSWLGATQPLGTSVLGTVGSPLRYAAPVETGRGAGKPMPPPDAIAGWVASHLGDVDPFIVARAIGARGIPGKEMLGRAVDGTRPAWQAIISRTVAGLVRGS